METLTPYARQFLPTLPRPDVDSVTGVPPSIALEQRTSRGGANSTVATVTEVAHYLRLLYAKVGELHCPKCDARRRADERRRALRRASTRSRDAAPKTVYAPAVRARKGTYLDLFTAASRAGVQAARVDGAIVADRPAAEAREDEGAHDRSHRPLRQARGARSRDVRPRARVGRGRAARRRGRAERRRPDGARADALDGARVPRVRHGRAGARPALVLVQHEAGAVRGVRGHGRRGRPGGARGRGPARRLRGVRRLAPQRGPARRAAARRDVRGDRPRARWRRALARAQRVALRGQRRARSRRRPHAELAAAPRVRRAGGPRLPRARSAGGDAVRRRDAAPAPQRAARQRPHRRALRPRRADDRPAPARHAAAPREPARSSPTWARRCSSSSTTPRRSAPPTTSSISARRRAQRRARRRRGARGAGARRTRARRRRARSRETRAHRAPEAADGRRVDRARRARARTT